MVSVWRQGTKCINYLFIYSNSVLFIPVFFFFFFFLLLFFCVCVFAFVFNTNYIINKMKMKLI